MIKINKELCVCCNLCISDCPEYNIKSDENNKAEIKYQDCMLCGHCFAVCPQKAIDIKDFKDNTITGDDMLYKIKSRRSIRQFLEKDIPKEILNNIIEAGRYSPTGKNAQDVEYIVLDKDKVKVETIAVKVFRRIFKLAKLVNSRYKDMEIEDTFFFKKAPIVILVVGKNKTNSLIAATNMSLVAESYGLGVLFSGFFDFTVRLSRKLKKEIFLPKNKKLYATLVIGYPKIKYKRGVYRKETNILWN